MWSTITYITTWSSGWTKKAIDCRADRRRNSCSGTTTRWRVAGNLVMGFNDDDDNGDDDDDDDGDDDDDDVL